jgi:cyclopropane-fatty-acyl-phospholipid synthase
MARTTPGQSRVWAAVQLSAEHENGRTHPKAGFAERRIRGLFEGAGVRIDGDRPWDIRVSDARFYSLALRRGPTGVADAYVNGWWECGAIDQMFSRLLRAGVPAAARWAPCTLRSYLRHWLLNLQSRARASANGRAHYDLGNELFQAMLDSTMAYSCGYWAGGARTLEEAQTAKLDLVCRKLGVREGHRVLDIGCGWGSFVKFAAERYGGECVGITVSPAQAELARWRCAGLPVTIELMDYRRLAGTFDRVVSIGMFEHVGQKNHRAYMRAVDRLLVDDGLALLHFFASARSFPNTSDTEVDWFERNIFPGMLIPSLAQVGRATNGLFVLEDLHNFGSDYHPTLMAWLRNFDEAWGSLRERHGYDERFRRLWRYYLQGAAGAFQCRKYQLWQLVLSKHGAPGGYRSVR